MPGVLDDFPVPIFKAHTSGKADHELNVPESVEGTALPDLSSPSSKSQSLIANPTQAGIRSIRHLYPAMPDFKEITKGGWHPKGKDGKSKESWRGDFKGIAQVSSWLGKGDQNSSNTTEASEHISRPLSSLKDPAAFGPPPKHIHFHGGAALPNQVIAHSIRQDIRSNQIDHSG